MLDQPLGHFQPLARAHWGAPLSFGAALLATIFMQRWQQPLRALETTRWWASNGRDLLHVISLALLTLSLLWLGYPGPSALLLGATILLALTLLAVPYSRPPTNLVQLLAFMTTALLLAAPIAVIPQRVARLLNSLAKALFDSLT